MLRMNAILRNPKTIMYNEILKYCHGAYSSMNPINFKQFEIPHLEILKNQQIIVSTCTSTA